MAKLSGIGCSSKTPAYFLREAHGFNGVHGRMPALVTGANAANRDVIYIGISGDGDSLSIGLGQLCHAIRRNVNVLYVLENNGVYGLTKGQFSASADPGSLSKKGEANTMEAIDGCLLALTLGATFVARSFSGDKAQLVPIIKAGLAHQGFAFIDVISPCVTFNDHEGSTKSYAYTREKNVEVVQADFVPPTSAITTAYEPGTVSTVMLHDGSSVRLRKVDENYDPTDRDRAVRLHPRAPEGRRSRDRAALHFARLERRARTEQHGGRPADAAGAQGPVSGKRGARKAAGAIPIEVARSRLSSLQQIEPGVISRDSSEASRRSDIFASCVSQLASISAAPPSTTPSSTATGSG